MIFRKNIFPPLKNYFSVSSANSRKENSIVYCSALFLFRDVRLGLPEIRQLLLLIKLHFTVLPLTALLLMEPQRNLFHTHTHTHRPVCV